MDDDSLVTDTVSRAAYGLIASLKAEVKELNDQLTAISSNSIDASVVTLQQVGP